MSLVQIIIYILEIFDDKKWMKQNHNASKEMYIEFKNDKTKYEELENNT